MDGLLVDTEPLYFQAEAEVATRYGRRFTRDVMQKMMGYKARRSIEIMKEELGLEGSVDEIMSLRDSIYTDLLMMGVSPMKGVFELLEWLENREFRKAVGTSSKPEFKDIIFNHLDLHHRFETIITGEDVSAGKPSPEIYCLAVRRLELQPPECIVLEDSAAGLKAAQGAGCTCIVVPNRYTDNQDFSEADLVAPDLTDKAIRDLFQRL
jgi:HAD superfamily hydrolase (TIGR01509 family)